jgi:nucleoside-diphosphate-sugar epimerase
MLGGAVARLLASRGDKVRTFQRRPSGICGVEDCPGDVTDPGAVRAAVDGMEAVVHLAARVSVTGPWRAFAAANIGGVRNVLAAMRAAGVPKLVHVSSPAVARSPAGSAAGPADPRRARGHYARSKAVGERLALAADRPGLAVAAIRPCLVWGPGDTQLIGRIIARPGRLVLIGPGTALVDTTYVDNAAEAIAAALDRAEHVHGEALVIANGQPRPVAELMAAICAIAGVPPPRVRVPFRLAWTAGAVLDAAWPALRRDDDPPITRFLAGQLATAHWFDQRRSRRLLGWEPRVDLDEGLARLRAWYAASGGRPGGEAEGSPPWLYNCGYPFGNSV